MSYSSLIKNSKEKVYHHAIATKILDLIEKLRMDEIGKSKRRWIWELIQNAKDAKYPGKSVSIEINLNENFLEEELEFKHNGQPFSIDNITFLIEQVSTKERVTSQNIKPKTTGKFGTGFLTTHLLSETVIIEGFVKESNLPYKKFDLQLDRSGQNIKDIIESIRISSEVLSKIEEAESILNYKEDDLNTVFHYPLDDTGINVAKTGLDDLDNTLPYTMVFVPEIKSVTIIHDDITYTALDEIIEKGDNIRIHTIKRKSLLDERLIHIAELSDEKVTIAIPVAIEKNDHIIIEEISTDLPKLFCDFPLIGSEDFYIPTVINSPYFNPTEPRSGVFLTDRTNEKVEENKAIIEKAITLFEILVDYASENFWDGMHHLANISTVPEKEWLSDKWFDDFVLKPIYKILSGAKIVDTQKDGRKPIRDAESNPQIWFPSASKKEIREKIWHLSNAWIPSIIPALNDIHNWYGVLWHQCGKLTIAEIADSINPFKNIETLQENLEKGVDPINWLNSFFDMVNYEGKFIGEIISDKYSLIPNQKGDFKKMTELHWDNNIDEAFKDVLQSLGEDIRAKLKNRSVKTNNAYDNKLENNIRHVPWKPDDIITKINKLLVKPDQPASLNASLDLISLFPPGNKNIHRGLLFDYSKKIFPSLVQEKKPITYDDVTVWTEADKIVISALVDNITNCQNIDTFTITYEFSSREAALSWLDSFITFLNQTDNDHYLNISERPILPNQNNQFLIKDMLFLDDDTIDEKLKDIAESLEFAIRNDLLNKQIFLELPPSRVLSQKIVAEKITNLILPKLAELPRSENTKDIFRLLYLWFRENKKTAESIFSDLYSSKHKLYDDDEVADNMQKAEDLKQLMEEFDINSIDQLRDIITNLTNNKSNSTEEDAQPITKETLVSLGIGSLKELEVALQDVNLAKVFLHQSVPTMQMFRYAQSLIERARNNILAFLETLHEYDCSEVEQTAPTILAGIKYNNTLIDVVTRPSDNGEVIIYYSSEKDVLEIPESQLWIDNGINNPQLLTLGKVLKMTGITKIPIQ